PGGPGGTERDEHAGAEADRTGDERAGRPVEVGEDGVDAGVVVRSGYAVDEVNGGLHRGLPTVVRLGFLPPPTIGRLRASDLSAGPDRDPQPRARQPRVRRPRPGAGAGARPAGRDRCWPGRRAARLRAG